MNGFQRVVAELCGIDTFIIKKNAEVEDLKSINSLLKSEVEYYKDALKMNESAYNESLEKIKDEYNKLQASRDLFAKIKEELETEVLKYKTMEMQRKAKRAENERKRRQAKKNKEA